MFLWPAALSPSSGLFLCLYLTSNEWEYLLFSVIFSQPSLTGAKILKKKLHCNFSPLWDERSIASGWPLSSQRYVHLVEGDFPPNKWTCLINLYTQIANTATFQLNWLNFLVMFVCKSNNLLFYSNIALYGGICLFVSNLWGSGWVLKAT